MGVQADGMDDADNQCELLYQYLLSNNNQLELVYQQMILKQHLYTGTTERLFPQKKEARKKEYNDYAIIYNRLSTSHNQQVEIYREECE